MTNGLLLWADDEMELLRAHLLFLEKKGYEVVTVTNGTDAIEECRKRTFDLVLLDEMMPGLSGLETLQRIKEITPQVPIVMVTKSEEEDIMNQAIGQQIADYLIKPVNPNQILLTLKKNIHRREIVTETVQTSYQQQFQQLSMQIMDCRTWEDWVDIYKRLVRWELELSQTDSQMTEMLEMQKQEANLGFAKYVKKNYLDWIKGGETYQLFSTATLNRIGLQLAYHVNTGKQKDRISVAMNVLRWNSGELQPAWYPNFPETLHDDYYKMFEAEEKVEVIDKNTGQWLKTIWRAKFGAANHAFDTYVYNRTALDVLADDICRNEIGLRYLDWATFWNYAKTGAFYYSDTAEEQPMLKGFSASELADMALKNDEGGA